MKIISIDEINYILIIFIYLFIYDLSHLFVSEPDVIHLYIY